MSASKIEEFTPEQARAAMAEGRALVVDVREPHEYAAERIHGALLFPLSTFDPSALPEDGTRKLIFHCGTGKRSGMAAQMCLDAGRSSASHVAGGIAAWKQAGLPTAVVDPSSGRMVDRR